MTKLVCIYRAGEEYIYARYDGRILTDKFGFVLPLAAYWIEEMRNAPQHIPTHQEPEAA